MSSVVVALPPQHEVLAASGDGLSQQEVSVRGAEAPRVSAIVPYRARTAARISSWVSVSMPSSPLVVTVYATPILTSWVLIPHSSHNRFCSMGSLLERLILMRPFQYARSV